MEGPFSINTGNRFHHLSLLSWALIREQVIFSTKASIGGDAHYWQETNITGEEMGERGGQKQ